MIKRKKEETKMVLPFIHSLMLKLPVRFCRSISLNLQFSEICRNNLQFRPVKFRVNYLSTPLGSAPSPSASSLQDLQKRDGRDGLLLELLFPNKTLNLISLNEFNEFSVELVSLVGCRICKLVSCETPLRCNQLFDSWFILNILNRILRGCD